jgi:putative ABC transport system ATP-binding protein
MALIELSGVSKTYRMGEMEVRALCATDLSIERGEFLAIMGPSGSGKSTLMNILGCLDTPDAGAYRLDGAEVGSLSRDQLAVVRNHKVGFVFQTFNLLSRTSAVENVELPLLYRGVPTGERRALAFAALKAVGLEGREGHHPNQLSGGQQQRVAIARALVNDPSLLLADEPTGNLDTKASVEIMDIFARLNRDKGITLVVVTHEPDIAAFSRRVIRFKDGCMVSDEVKTA